MSLFHKKNTWLFILTLFLVSCKTIYFVPNGYQSIYLIKTKNKVILFDYEGKNKYSKRQEWPYRVSIYDHKIKLDNQQKRIIYTFLDAPDRNDTLYFSDSVLRSKKEVLPIFYSSDFDNNIVCNNIILFDSPKAIDFMVRYIGDTVLYLNNQPEVPVLTFDYYAYYRGESIQSYAQPITFYVSKNDGMVMGMDYYGRSIYTLALRDTTISHLGQQIIDYHKVFCGKRKLKKLLM